MFWTGIEESEQRNVEIWIEWLYGREKKDPCIPLTHGLYKCCITLQKYITLAILFNINTSRIVQNLFPLSQSAVITCSTFVLWGLIEHSLKLIERFPLTSERVDHLISSHLIRLYMHASFPVLPPWTFSVSRLSAQLHPHCLLLAECCGGTSP